MDNLSNRFDVFCSWGFWVLRKWVFLPESIGAKLINAFVCLTMIATDLFGVYATFLPLPDLETFARVSNRVDKSLAPPRTSQEKNIEDNFDIPYLSDETPFVDLALSHSPRMGVLDAQSPLATTSDLTLELQGLHTEADAGVIRQVDLPLTRVSLSPYSQDLTVTTTVTVDDVRYPMAVALPAGSTVITISEVVTDIISGDEILIISLLGEGIGTYETETETNVAVGTTSLISITSPLENAYDGSVSTNKVMLQKVPHYNEVIVESGGTLTAHPWDGEIGGVVFFRAMTVTITGTGKISVDELGFTEVNNGPGAPTPGNTFAGEVNAGGAHGGYGGGGSAARNWGAVSAPYGSANNPATLGSAGIMGWGSYAGGRGGGILILDVAHTLRIGLNGKLEANGENSAKISVFGHIYGCRTRCSPYH